MRASKKTKKRVVWDSTAHGGGDLWWQVSLPFFPFLFLHRRGKTIQLLFSFWFAVLRKDPVFRSFLPTLKEREERKKWWVLDLFFTSLVARNNHRTGRSRFVRSEGKQLFFN